MLSLAPPSGSSASACSSALCCTRSAVLAAARTWTSAVSSSSPSWELTKADASSFGATRALARVEGSLRVPSGESLAGASSPLECAEQPSTWGVASEEGRAAKLGRYQEAAFSTSGLSLAKSAALKTRRAQSASPLGSGGHGGLPSNKFNPSSHSLSLDAPPNTMSRRHMLPWASMYVMRRTWRDRTRPRDRIKARFWNPVARSNPRALVQ